jgi:hypothetical protein
VVRPTHVTESKGLYNWQGMNIVNEKEKDFPHSENFELLTQTEEILKN